MAGRGRGGGGGRGRGRGAISFNVEQLGFGVGEALPGPVLQPPPLYPPLERRPVPLESGSEIEYLLALKREFVEFLKYSPAYVLPAAKVKDIERYSDYKNVETPNRTNAMIYDWNRFPAELRIHTTIKKKKRLSVSNTKPAKKARKLEDVSNKLEELEKLEAQGDDVEEKDEENKEEEKERGEQQEEEVEEEEDQDEEMDDGTDYVNNYFDNGESYLDEEDDNLDDGPVY